MQPRPRHRPPRPGPPATLSLSIAPPLSLFHFLLLFVLNGLTAAAAPTATPLTTASFRFFGPLPLTSSSHGANPLAALHKRLLPTLRNLTTFPSEAAVGGHATWRDAASPNATRPAMVSAPFDDAATPYEAFAVAPFTVPSSAPRRVVLLCDAPLAIHSDNPAAEVQRCPARDPDHPRSVCPLDLPPGKYTALVHVMSGARNASFQCAHYSLPSSSSSSLPPVLLSLGHVVAPAVVVHADHPVNKTRLAGDYAAFTVQNLHTHAWAVDGVVTLLKGPPGVYVLRSPQRDLAPVQAAAMRIRLGFDDKLLAPSTPYDMPEPSRLTLSFAATFRQGGGTVRVVQNVSLAVVTWPPRAYSFTFRDIDGSVQMAAVVPPQNPCQKCPPLLSTHGAGVDATARAWTEAYRRQSGSWVILPTGRRRYGLNWHGPQLLAALAALSAFEREMPGVPVRLRGKWRPRRDAWLAAGHSMGGHGALVLATHFPDALVAALPAMAWLRLDQYGSGAKREDMTFADSALRSLLSVASSEWDADMYAENLLGIPFLARVGGADDNVPPTNLRRFVRLLYENELDHNMSSVVGLNEVPGKGHWFDGVVDDDKLQAFFDEHLKPGLKPALPKQFSVFTMNPATSGSRGGLRILSTDVPFEVARLRVSRDNPRPGTWFITGTNVQRFRYMPVLGIAEQPSELVLGDRGARGIPIDSEALARGGDFIDLCARPAPHWAGPPPLGGRPVAWRRCDDRLSYGTKRSKLRGPDTAGPAVRVLSGRRIVIMFPEGNHRLRGLAVRYANALFGHGIDAEVSGDETSPTAGGGTNLILLGTLEQNRATQHLARGGWTADVTLRKSGAVCIGSARCFATPGTGVTFLAGGPGRSLLLYVTGVDEEGVLGATEFLPYSPASNVPEWVVVSARRGLGFRGLGGVLAAGFWDVLWKLESRRVYPGDFALPGVADAQSCAAAIGSRASRNVLAVIVVGGIVGGIAMLFLRSRQRYAVVGEDEATQLVHGGGVAAQGAQAGMKGKKEVPEEAEGLMAAQEAARRSGGLNDDEDADDDDADEVGSTRSM